MSYSVDLCIFHRDHTIQPIHLEEFPDAVSALQFISDPTESLYEKMDANENIFLRILEDEKLFAFSVCEEQNVWVVTAEGVFCDGEPQERPEEFGDSFITSYAMRNLYQADTKLRTALGYLTPPKSAKIVLETYLQMKKFWPSREERWRAAIEYLLQCVESQTAPHFASTTLGPTYSSYGVRIFNSVIEFVVDSLPPVYRIRLETIRLKEKDLKELRQECAKLIPVVEAAMAIYLSFHM